MTQRRIVYFLANGVLVACLYFGLFADVDGARNVALFMSWITALASIAALDKDFMDERLATGFHSVPLWFDRALDCGIVGALVWTGWWITGVAYFFGICAVAHGREEAEKRAKEKTA